MFQYKRICLQVAFAAIALILLFACAPTKFNVVPEKTVLSPALFKKPIKFAGSGFQANEPVTIELLVPKGMKIKGLRADEDRVGIGVATADAKGNFEAPMGALTTLNTLFQVGWKPTIKPDFKKATPLPAGSYTILATGIESGKVAKSTLEILAPPKKK